MFQVLSHFERCPGFDKKRYVKKIAGGVLLKSHHLAHILQGTSERRAILDSSYPKDSSASSFIGKDEDNGEN